MGPFYDAGTHAKSLPNLPSSKYKDCNTGWQQLCRQLKLSKASLTSAVLRIGTRLAAGARAGMEGIPWGVIEQSQVASRFLVLAPAWKVSSLRAHFIWPPLRVKLPKRNSWATIRSAVPVAKFPKPVQHYDWLEDSKGLREPMVPLRQSLNSSGATSPSPLSR